MPDLDSIHYKFFPKSKTAPWGKKLIVMAWIIEILVASVSFSIAMLFFLSSGESNLKIAQLASDLNVNNIIVGLSFVVVTVIELTKIPLASVFYYAGKIAWRVTFFLALLAVNFLTFETIMQGFELAYNQRSEKVDDIRKQVEIKRDEIANIETKADLSEIDFKIEKVNQDIKILVDQKKDIEIRIIEEKTKLIEEAQVANPNISRLQNSIENKIKEKEQYENQRRDFVQQRSEIKTGLFSGSKKKIEALDLEISKTEEKISNIDNELSNLNNELAKATNAGESRNESKIRSIEEKANLEINSLNKQIEDIQNNQLKPLQDQKSKNLESSLEQEEKRLILNDELTELQKELKEEAKESQIYRIAIKIKVFGEFISGGKLEDQITEIDEEILDLEKSKFKKSFLFFWERDYVPSDAYIKLVDNKILVLEDRKNKMLNQVLSDEKKEIDEADLSQKDVDRAFWIWFGSMALVISIIGSLVALAGFHLQDERMHEIRNRPVKERFRRFFRNIAWIPVYINRYIWTGIKRLTKPKIVEKVVEVEKEVEKIVEKNIGEKIVYEKVEVPKEVIKKEMVYVPLPTDDEELLKRGPFKQDDKDKK